MRASAGKARAAALDAAAIALHFAASAPVPSSNPSLQTVQTPIATQVAQLASVHAVHAVAVLVPNPALHVSH